jgi:hypothetical protein
VGPFRNRVWLLVPIGLVVLVAAVVGIVAVLRHSDQCTVAVSGTTIDVVFEGPRATNDCKTFAAMTLDETRIQPGTLNPVGAIIAEPYGAVVCVHRVPDQWRIVPLPSSTQATSEAEPTGYVTVTIRDAGWPLGGSDPTNFCTIGTVKILPNTYI